MSVAFLVSQTDEMMPAAAVQETQVLSGSPGSSPEYGFREVPLASIARPEMFTPSAVKPSWADFIPDGVVDTSTCDFSRSTSSVQEQEQEDADFSACSFSGNQEPGIRTPSSTASGMDFEHRMMDFSHLENPEEAPPRTGSGSMLPMEMLMPKDTMPHAMAYSPCFSPSVMVPCDPVAFGEFVEMSPMSAAVYSPKTSFVDMSPISPVGFPEGASGFFPQSTPANMPRTYQLPPRRDLPSAPIDTNTDNFRESVRKAISAEKKHEAAIRAEVPPFPEDYGAANERSTTSSSWVNAHHHPTEFGQVLKRAHETGHHVRGPRAGGCNTSSSNMYMQGFQAGTEEPWLALPEYQMQNFQGTNNGFMAMPTGWDGEAMMFHQQVGASGQFQDAWWQDQMGPGGGWYNEGDCGQYQQVMPGAQSASRYTITEWKERDSDEAVTTFMMHNVPKDCTQSILIEQLDELGLEGKFDLVYVPVDRIMHQNVGYAFINFVDEDAAKEGEQLLTSLVLLCKRRPRSGKASRQACWLSQAHLQGLRENLKHYRKTSSKPLVRVGGRWTDVLPPDSELL